MNEQRKVIYKRRQQILTGADLRDEMLESLATSVQNVVDVYCPNDYQEEWDTERLVTEITNYYPTKFTSDELKDATSIDHVYESLLAEATEHYETREQEIGEDTTREIERHVMMSIIDQRWREHLYEMDYLQEGINLRAMGQKDPLVEWQREGFDMFSQMMTTIQDDFVKYVMHVEVVTEAATHEVRNVQYTAPEDPVQGAGAMVRAAARHAAEMGDEEAAAELAPEEAPVVQQVVKSDWEKTGRNDPCPCGSGKKYKLCHGRNN
jgi:preprotein translocase subunit SecA